MEELKLLKDKATKGDLGSKLKLLHIYSGLNEEYEGDTNELLKMSNSGSLIIAQTYVSKGYAEGLYGLEKNKKKFLECVHKNYIGAQMALDNLDREFFLDGATEEEKEILKRDPVVPKPEEILQILECAFLGDTEAKLICSIGYAEGKYGFKVNPSMLNKIGDLNWGISRLLLIRGHLNSEYGLEQNPNKIKDFADLNWPEAKSKVVNGYLYGKNGFPQSIDTVKDLAIKGWVEAQEELVTEYTFKAHKDSNNIINLLFAAFLDWPKARKIVYEGYKNGWDGFEKDNEKAEHLKKLWEEKDEL